MSAAHFRTERKNNAQLTYVQGKVYYDQIQAQRCHLWTGDRVLQNTVSQILPWL